MVKATAAGQEVAVLRREEGGRPGVLRINGRYYDYTSGPLGYAVEALSTGAIYRVRVVAGRPQWCGCGDWKFRRPAGGCKHMAGTAAAIAAW